MQRRRYGNTDMLVSILGFGASEIGYRKVDATTVVGILGLALDHGVNLVDTAECYHASEELIGQALKGRRHQVYLFTKCGHGSLAESPDWSVRTLEATINRSLQRLRTDYVDVIHLHSCSEKILRQGEVVDTLLRAKREGKTRYVGYSGDSRDAQYALSLGVFDSLETSINVADQEAITLTLPEAQSKGVGVVAKRPIANVAWRHSKRPEDEYEVDYWARLQKLAYEPALSVDVALRFTWSVSGVASAIVGTSSRESMLKNIGYAEWPRLSDEHYAAIRERWREISTPMWTGLE